MPYKGQGASATTHMDILREKHVRDFLDRCTCVPRIEGKENEISRRLLDVSDRVKEINEGIILATDGSPYESIVEERFPSIRVGFLKFAHVIIKVAEYQRLRHSNNRFIDPIEMARIQRQSQSLSVVLPSAGITNDDNIKSKTYLRKTIFDTFRSDPFAAAGHTLYDTLVDLMRRVGNIELSEGQECIKFKKGKKSPIDGEKLPSDLFVPLEPGYAYLPDNDTDPMFVTDALRVHEAFVDEGSNLECFNRLMNAMEHLLLVHLIRSSHEIDPTITGNLFAIVDGPLAIFGEPARFHRGIMSLLADIKADCRKHGMPGPLVIGVSKTGKVVEHAQLINHLLQSEDGGKTKRQGTWILPIDDDYRFDMIQPNVTDRSSNFGDETYYGQNFIVRTATGKIFDLCLNYPFSAKGAKDGVPFKQRKMQIEAYGEDLSRAVSIIELMQTDLYDDALIAIHLAHKYASIAHSPAGRSLDHFVRQVINRRTDS